MHKTISLNILKQTSAGISFTRYQVNFQSKCRILIILIKKKSTNNRDENSFKYKSFTVI